MFRVLETNSKEMNTTELWVDVIELSISGKSKTSASSSSHMAKRPEANVTNFVKKLQHTRFLKMILFLTYQHVAANYMRPSDDSNFYTPFINLRNYYANYQPIKTFISSVIPA